MKNIKYSVVNHSFYRSQMSLSYLRHVTSCNPHMNIGDPEDNAFATKTTMDNSNPMEYFSWLQQSAPRFPVDASKITVIHEPNVFYNTLIEKCKKAVRRITLASLYLGTGELEGNLVAAIRESVVSTHGKLQVNILLDHMRGSRGKNNSQKMLQPLLTKNYVDSCKVFLYHTPRLRGVLKTVIPNRFNELVGLQHMKVYIFDECLIITGANLSENYFTNRQDRYIVIEDCKELCDFYDKLIRILSEFSLRVLPDNVISSENELDLHPLTSPIDVFNRALKDRIVSLYHDELERSKAQIIVDKHSTADTWIFPLIQMGQYGIYYDNEVTLRLLKTAPTDATLSLATGYFNLTEEYSNAILGNCEASCQILTAHPTANGFFGAGGIAGSIPAAYTTIEKKFSDRIEKMGLHKRISLREYIRPGWTYHAKGLWYTLPNHTKPSFTLIGSSNFGYRSVKRDIETQIAVVTKNEKLQYALQEEYERIYTRSEAVSKNKFFERDRIAPAWVCIAVFLFRYYF